MCGKRCDAGVVINSTLIIHVPVAYEARGIDAPAEPVVAENVGLVELGYAVFSEVESYFMVD